MVDKSCGHMKEGPYLQFKSKLKHIIILLNQALGYKTFFMLNTVEHEISSFRLLIESNLLKNYDFFHA